MINTIDPEFFRVNIEHSRQTRKQAHAVKQNKVGYFKPDLYQLLLHSNQVPRGK